MGKSDPPPAPDYKSAAIATSNSNRFDEVSPFGQVSWNLREGSDPNNPQPGDYIRSTTLAPGQQALFDQSTALGQRLLADYGDGQGASDAAYRRATRYYNTNFGQEHDALRTQLLNAGLAEGSQAYQNAMGQFDQRRDSAYADAADRAVATGEQSQNSAIARLAQVLAMTRGAMPASGNTAGGPDLLSAMNSQYQAQLGATNASNAASANTMGGLTSAGMATAMFF